MKYASYKFPLTGNIGDEIQAYAAEQFLPAVDKRFDRDNLKNIEEKDKYLLIMNGWFSHFPESCIPCSDSIIPVFFGFHITTYNHTREYFSQEKPLDYFKKHEPIGCRDESTKDFLNFHGINAYFSKCLSLTYKKRKQVPCNGKVILVETNYIPIPRELRKGAINVSHMTNPKATITEKRLIAKELINLYREEARLVITTRLHCALPCIAMGIPVIFFGEPKDPRVSILTSLNVKIYKIRKIGIGKRWQRIAPKNIKGVSWLNKIRKVIGNQHINSFLQTIFSINLLKSRIILESVDWNPEAVPFEQEKKKIVEQISNAISNKILNEKG